MIDPVIHFVYVGGRAFSFIHFLAIYTAWKVQRPQRIYLHCSESPQGEWWLKAQPLVTINRVAPVREVDGNAVHYPAHQADVIRLEMLLRHGGIYLDLDVLSLRALTPFLQHDFVMGMEAGAGLCNAVIMTRPDAPFLRRWRAAYRDFNGEQWSRHSVQLPWRLACERPQDIHVADQFAFFHPGHNDPTHPYLWGEQPSLPALALRTAKNLARLAAGLFVPQDAARRAVYTSFHALRPQRWHLQRLRQSYCLHLWEGLWGERYLSRVTPDYLAHSDSHFARVLRDILSPDEIAAMARPGPLPPIAAAA